MSITIWEPARYVAGFATDSSGLPINGALAAPPFDRDTKVREIVRFDGWKETHYCDTGEFEIVTDEARPEDIRRGLMVDIEGDMFVIEDYEWSIERGVYACKMGGRDFWKFPESEIDRRYIGIPYDTTDGQFNGREIVKSISTYMHYVDQKAGWFRDMRRFPWAVQDFPDYYQNITQVDMPASDAAAFLAKSAGNQVAHEIMPYASEWRLFASWFGVGIRFRFAFNRESGVYEIHPEIYQGADNGVRIRSTDRGVSGFKYVNSTRTAVNAAFVGWESKRFSYMPDYIRYKGDSFGGLVTDHGEDTNRGNISNILDAVSGKDGAGNYAERAAWFSEKYLNAGAAPQDSDNTEAQMKAWIKTAVEAAYVPTEQSFEFTYDNTGLYKYGVHFNLGDWVTIEDRVLDVSSKQRLTSVKTTYKSSGKTYEFDFNGQRISQGETLKRKISEIDRRTNLNGKRF